MTKEQLKAAAERPIANHGFISAKYQTLSLPTLNYSEHESSMKLSMAENEAQYSEISRTEMNFSISQSSEKLSTCKFMIEPHASDIVLSESPPTEIGLFTPIQSSGLQNYDNTKKDFYRHTRQDTGDSMDELAKIMG